MLAHESHASHAEKYSAAPKLRLVQREENDFEEERHKLIAKTRGLKNEYDVVWRQRTNKGRLTVDAAVRLNGIEDEVRRSQVVILMKGEPGLKSDFEADDLGGWINECILRSLNRQGESYRQKADLM